MQFNEDSTLTETPSQSQTTAREISIGTDGEGNLAIEIDGDVLVIRDNATTDKELFEALHYVPFCRYTIVRDSHDDVHDEVFDEFYRLMERIVEEINKIDTKSV